MIETWPSPSDGVQTLIRGLVVLVLFGLLLYWIPVERTFLALKQVHFNLLFLAVLIRFVLFMISTIKLRHLFLKLTETEQTFRESLVYVLGVYLTANFFSNFLPTNVGGDVVKIQQLQSRDRDWGSSTAAVFMERFSGILAVLCLAVFVALPPLNLLEPFGLEFIRYPFLGMVGILVVLLTWKGPSLFSTLTPRFPSEAEGSDPGFLYRFTVALERYRNLPRTLLWIGFLSILYHTVRCGYLWVVLLAFDQSLPFLYIVPIIPIVTFVSLIPVSLGSLGLREGALTFCLIALGTPAPEALAVALLTRFISYGFSFLGGLYYLLKPGLVRSY